MPAWLYQGTAFAVAAAEIGSNRPQLVQVNWPSGADSHITQDTEEYRDVSSTTDSKNLITLLAARQSWLWIGPLAEPSKLRSMGKSGRFFGVSWTRSNQVISQTEINNRAGLWLLDVAANKQQLLTDEPHEYQDTVASPDGKYLVYSSDRDGTLHLWRADADGRHATRLTSAVAREISPSFTPDSQWVVYASYEGGFSIWKVSINGGQPVRLTGQQAEKPVFSPDGTMIACEYLMDDGTWRAVALNSGTGRIVHIFPDIPTGSGALPVRWTADGRQLLYVAVDNNQVSNLWGQPIAGGNPRELTHFTDDSIFAFALSPDGKTLALVRGKETSDVVRINAN
jgi:TolB protein